MSEKSEQSVPSPTKQSKSVNARKEKGIVANKHFESSRLEYIALGR